MTTRQWRRVPHVTAGMAAVVVLLAGLASGSGTPASGSHAANTVVRGASHPVAANYHGVIGAVPSAVETDAQVATPPPVDGKVYDACLNPQLYQGLQPASAYVAGWSDASKLNGSTAVGSPAPALAQGNPPGGGYDNAFPPPIVNGEQYTCGLAKLQLDYNGQREFPPLTATFLAFGFMPVTATVYLTQVGSAPVTGVGYGDEGKVGNTTTSVPYTVVSTAQVSLRLSDVKVNGTSLDVGSHCQTIGPLTSPGNPTGYNGLVLSGGSFPGDPLPPYPYGIGITGGGALAGTATIPPFTGCVTPGGDNLDALLDASVSGPDNYIKVVQAPLCYNVTANCSAPSVPAYKPLWTVKHGGTYHGGTYTASGPVTISQVGIPLQLNAYWVTCTGSSITAAIPDAAGGPLRGGDLGTVTWTGFSGCTGYYLQCPNGRRSCPPPTVQPVTDNSTWQITQQGTGFLDGYTYSSGNNPPVSGVTTTADIDDVTLTLNGTNVPGATNGNCTAEVTGPVTRGSYANSGSVLQVGPSSLSAAKVWDAEGNMSVISSDCPRFQVNNSPSVPFAAVDSTCPNDLSTICPYYLSAGRGPEITSP